MYNKSSIGVTNLANTGTKNSGKVKKDAMAVINSQIKTKEFAGLYLLYGKERYLVNEYRDRLIQALTDKEDSLNFVRYAGSGVDTSEIISFCRELPFFAERRVVLVENSGLFKSSNEEFAKQLTQIEPTSVVVFVEMEVNAKYKLYKTVERCGNALEFVTPTESMLVKWVAGMFKKADVRVSETAVYGILEAAAMDMNCIKNEVDKLLSYAADKGSVSSEDVELLCSREADAKLYQMVECITAGQKDKASRLYHDLLGSKEPVIKINAGIMGQFKTMLLVKLAGGMSYDGIAGQTGEPVWKVRKLKNVCRSYTAAKLRMAVDMCVELDYRLKTGLSQDAADMEVLIVQLCELK